MSVMALSFQSGMSMDFERFTSGQYVSMESNTHVNIKILLVDDDSTILAIASTLLRMFKYEVTAVKSPVDALSTLRGRRDEYDLMVTDYHMPEMNGLELQKVVQTEYQLPVIVMSADERECIIMKTLECGAAFFIAKPIKAEDVKNIWQYAVASRMGRSVMSPVDKGGVISDGYKLTEGEVEAMEIARLGEAMEMEGCEEAMEAEEVDSMVSVAEIKGRRTRRSSTKRKHKKKERDVDGGENSQSTNLKRSKVVWTTALHNLFLQALNQIGLDKAVPKKILEYMSVPGLTRENVASHLQKYRIFLRRVADKTYTRSTSLEKPTKSSFRMTRRSPINDFQEDGSSYSRLSRLSLPADFGKNLSSSSPGILLGSSGGSLSAIQFSSQSLDVTETGIGFHANSSGLQMIGHRVDSVEASIPLVARLSFGNAVSYLQQFQSKEWPLVPLGGVGMIRNTDQRAEKQNTGPSLTDNSFLEKFSTGKTAEDSINPTDDYDLMNNSGRFMDILTQGDPSVGLNGSEHPTQVFPSPLKNDLAAAAPNEASKEDPPTPVEKTAAFPNTLPQRHAGDNDFFDLLYEHMHYTDHRRSDSSGDTMGIFSTFYESPDVQGHGNEDLVNPTQPWRSSQVQARQDQARHSATAFSGNVLPVQQQPAGQGIPTASLPKPQDIWTNHPTAEDQIWAEDFIDSLLDSTSPYLL